MTKEKELSLNLYVIEEDKYLGPTILGTFEHHCPRLLISSPQVFNAEPGNYLVFRDKANDFVDLDQSYKQLGIEKNETIIMTKIYDPEALSLFCKVFVEEDDPESIIDTIPAFDIEVPVGFAVVKTDAVAWLRMMYQSFKSR